MSIRNEDVIAYWIAKLPLKNKKIPSLHTDGTGLYSYDLLIGEWKNEIPLLYNYTAISRIGPYGHLIPSAGYYSNTTTAHINEAVAGGGLLVPTKGIKFA